MVRRYFVSLLRRCTFFLMAVALGCSAQSKPATDIDRTIERQVRAHFSIPAVVKVTVGERKPSEFSNFDLVTLTFEHNGRSQTSEFLLSKDGKTLARLTKIDLTKDPYAEVMSKIDITGRPWKGAKDAKVVLVNYDDFQCPYCSRMHDTLVNDILKTYGDRVKLVYKDYPLYQIHPWANRASVNANCLGELSNDAYWSFADYLHTNAPEINGQRGTPLQTQFAALDRITLEQGRKFNVDAAKLQACITKQDDTAVRKSVQEAEEIGVQATPTVFVNGRKIDGAVPPEELRAVIEQALRDVETAQPGATK